MNWYWWLLAFLAYFVIGAVGARLYGGNNEDIQGLIQIFWPFVILVGIPVGLISGLDWLAKAAIRQSKRHRM